MTHLTRTLLFRRSHSAHGARALGVAGLAALLALAAPATAQTVSGELKKWHPIEVSFSGGDSYCETSDPTTDGLINPFLDRRLNVLFTHLNQQSQPTHSFLVPGFYAGDGAGGSCGNTWKVRFNPDADGTWVYTASFRRGPDINVSLDPNEGSPTAFDGQTGSFFVDELDKTAPGFLGLGRLEYVGEHYLKHRDGPFFLKGGTDSPENLFACNAFDDTFDQPGGVDTTGLVNGIHEYAPHVQDFGPTGLGETWDPFWQSNLGGDSRGLIGMLNYLSSKQVNSIYFLPMNLGGDGRDTYPFVDPDGSAYGNTHYDLSKLYQWNLALDHAQRKGIMWNCVLAETEIGNETWFGSNANSLTTQRKLFYREMVARFSYLNGIKWNICEETDFQIWAVRDFADYIQQQDPYGHMITFHTNTLPTDGSYSDYTAVLGDPLFSATSMQHLPNQTGGHVEKWRSDSANAGRKWVVDSDEQNGGLSIALQEDRRKRTLYDVLFSGGNIEWYFGYFPLPEGGDLRCEDMRTREDMWDYTWYARDLMLKHMPFQMMVPDDDLVTGETQFLGGAEVFAWPNNLYAIYYPSTNDTGTINLPAQDFVLRWYDPRTGRFEGGLTPVTGGGPITVGSPPSMVGEDWVVLIQRDVQVFQLEFTAFLPGATNTTNSASITGGTPNSQLLVFWTIDGTGLFPLPGCTGAFYNLVNTQFGFATTTDLNGDSNFSILISSGPPPGLTVWLQALDPFGCGTSNVTSFTW